MDIEGAEPKALEGALKTIKKFKPKLAISIYHNLSDYSQIIPWLDSLNLKYRFLLDIIQYTPKKLYYTQK